MSLFIACLCDKIQTEVFVLRTVAALQYVAHYLGVAHFLFCVRAAKREKQFNGKDKDKKKELALVTRDFLGRDAYLKSRLMHVTQRYVKCVLKGCIVTGTIRS